jgi:hypothetical protein
MYVDNSHEELSRQSLVAKAATINQTGRAFLRQSADAQRRASARQDFRQTHGSVGNITLAKVAEHLSFAVALFAIYILDVVLFGGPSQYMAALLSGDGESLIGEPLAKYGFPACFIAIEVFIALQIERARQEERFAFGSSAARRAWFALGVVVALVMPLAAKAVAESAGVVDQTSVSVPMIAVMAIISFAAHVLILFGGRRAQEAKEYLLFTFARWLHEKRESATDTRAKMTLANFNSMFIGYVHAWRQHNSHYAHVPSGPFDAEIVELLKRQFPQVASGATGLSRDSES